MTEATVDVHASQSRTTLEALHEQIHYEMDELRNAILRRAQTHAAGDGTPADGERVESLFRTVLSLNVGIDVMMANARLNKFPLENEELEAQLPQHTVKWDDFLRSLRLDTLRKLRNG